MKEALTQVLIMVLAVVMWGVCMVAAIAPFVLTVLAAIWLAGKIGLVS